MQRTRIEYVRAHPELLCHFPGDGLLISGHHLDLHAHLPCARYGCLGLFARRIGHRQHARKLPFSFLIRASYAQRTKATSGKIIHSFFDDGLDPILICRHLEDDLRRTLGHKELLSVRALDGCLRPFVNRIEGLEMKHLITLERLIVLDPGDHSQVDGVLVFRA